jgi:hypothetical protein
MQAAFEQSDAAGPRFSFLLELNDGSSPMVWQIWQGDF